MRLAAAIAEAQDSAAPIAPETTPPARRWRIRRPERVEIRRPGPHGRLRWQVVSDVAITWEQLELFESAPEPAEQPGRRVRIRRNQPTLFDD